MGAARPLIAHVVHRFAMGGMENGIVNLINGMDPRYRHAIVCLDRSSDFVQRLHRDDVIVREIRKRPGKDPGHYARLWRTLRALGPAVVHTRNIGTLEAGMVARLGVTRHVVHGEHGFDVHDLHGRNSRYRRLRRLASPFVRKFLCVSRQIATWLEHDVGLPAAKLEQIYNGVDTDKFTPERRAEARGRLRALGVAAPFVVGSVGRLEPVKNPGELVAAFARQCEDADFRAGAQLVMVGDGSLGPALREDVAARGIEDRVHLLGARDDVADLLPGFDAFVLPSLNEGISNTILEALACGVPVIASRVGGNDELFDEPDHGAFYASGDVDALGACLARFRSDEVARARQSREAREHVLRRFSLSRMIERYEAVYDRYCAS